MSAIIANLDDHTELAWRIAEVIRIRSHDQAGLAHYAATDLRAYLARVMARERM